MAEETPDQKKERLEKEAEEKRLKELAKKEKEGLKVEVTNKCKASADVVKSVTEKLVERESINIARAKGAKKPYAVESFDLLSYNGDTKAAVVHGSVSGAVKLDLSAKAE